MADSVTERSLGDFQFCVPLRNVGGFADFLGKARVDVGPSVTKED
jgi:hypothetical protein